MADPPHELDPAFLKVLNMLGRRHGEALVSELMKEIDAPDLRTPEARLAFGRALVRRGGALEAIGRAIRVQAFLLGAEDVDGGD